MHSPRTFQFFLLNPNRCVWENDFGGHPSQTGDPYPQDIHNLKINSMGDLFWGSPTSSHKEFQTLKKLRLTDMLRLDFLYIQKISCR